MPPVRNRSLAMPRRAFTLIELLVSMAVLALIVSLVGQMINDTTKVTVGNGKHLDADGQARMVFDRIGTDLARMLRRRDVDCIISRPNGGSGHAVSDRMFFYSDAPSYYNGDTSSAQALQARSELSLLGYRINAGWQLERLGKLLTWDGTPAAGTGTGTYAPGGIMFLSCPSAALNPDPRSTLAGTWPTTIGTASDNPPFNGTDSNFHVLAEQVFRLEICYLLKPVKLQDGTVQAAAYSGVPVAAPADGRTNNLTATRAPSASDDSAAGFQGGSRWYDPLNCRAYLCVSNTAGQAVWTPLGLDDVAGIVVAIAILDPASAAVVPTTTATVDGATVSVPNLAALAGALADLPLANAAAGSTAPDLTATPPRLMAEAWNNTLLGAGFAQTVQLPQSTVAQVRVYQRCFPLNGN